MFLAINELLREKLRFLLITFVILLVSYLAFFLTGLAYGLATSYTQGIDKWNAAGIILQKDANLPTTPNCNKLGFCFVGLKGLLDVRVVA